MKKVIIALVIFFAAQALVLGAIYCAVCFYEKSWSTQEISYYQALSGETKGQNTMCNCAHIPCSYNLPMLSELGDYEDIRFIHSGEQSVLFASHAYVLILKYDSQNYDVQKQTLAEQYTPCTQESQGFSDGIMTDFTYKMDGFEIHATEGGEYPKEMLFIGTSDEQQEIAIIYYYDSDLDYIDEPLGKFIDNNTGWSEVVR